jgi:hypothetical protein
MFRRIEPGVSASRGTIAGDVLWLATIAFISVVIPGLAG